MDMIEVWKMLADADWLTIGNGWRNVFLLSCLLQAAALGTLCAVQCWFSKTSRVACFLTGVSATPLVQYLWMLIIAVLWPHAPKLVYIAVLPVLAGGYGLFLLLRYFRKIPTILSSYGVFLKRILRFDKPALISLCFAAALAILLLPVCIRGMTSMNSASPGDSGEYLGLAVRFCEDRNLSALLEKNENEGHFRGHSHFPSMELYMSYGLMHTQEVYGYPYDKPTFTGLGSLVFYMTAAYAALLVILTKERKRWILLGMLLLNLVPSLYDSALSAPRDIWRILAVLIGVLFFEGLKPCNAKNWKGYCGKLFAAFVLCFTVMSAHVVCFVVLPFVVLGWVLWRWYEAACTPEKRGGKALLSAIGIACAGAVGTLIAFSGNLWCYLQWGMMSPKRLMTEYTTAPWYEAYMLGEYKLEETTTQLDFWKARYDIVMSYATPIGLWGMRLAAVFLVLGIVYLIWTLVCRHKAARLLIEKKEGVEFAGVLMFAAFMTLLTLAPMSGLLDTSLYSFSGSFLALQRYTLQWFLLAAIMICTALAALENAWIFLGSWVKKFFQKNYAGVKEKTWTRMLSEAWESLPAVLCAALCVIAFVQGTSQTGYSASFYRDSRAIMEKDSNLDHPFLRRYGLLLTAERYVPAEEKILLSRAGYQYPLRARGYVLTSNPIVPLMNCTAEEVPSALLEMNVAMLATEPEFWDERYFSKSALSDYLNNLPPEQILQDGNQMRLYILDADVAKMVSEALNAAENKIMQEKANMH